MKQLLCPICKQPVKMAAPEFPFCSERCRTTDLGNWASGSYKVSAPLAAEDLDDLPLGENGAGDDGEK